MDGLDLLDPLLDIPEYICDEEAIQNCMTSLTESLYEEEQNKLPSSNDEEVVVAPLDISVEDFQEQNQEWNNFLFVPPTLPDCRECILLREIIHTNGAETIKLLVHGGQDLFFHAFCQVDGMQSVVEPSFVDFSGFSYEQVKQFLIDYGLLRLQNGYLLIQDSISSFYDALSVKIDCNMPLILPEQAVVSQPTPAVANNPMQPAVNNSIRTDKTGMSAQRERTANLHISEFADYFHLRLVDAAKEIGICSTVLKKVCRKYGLKRWPYRKVSSIDKKIKKLQYDLRVRGGQGATEIEAEIGKLIAERASLCLGYNPYITPYT